MNMTDWDEELATLAAEVSLLTSQLLKTRTSHNKGLVARKMATVTSQLKIERMIRRVRSFCEREFLLLPKEKALLHWCGIFLEKLEKYYEQKQRNQNRILWLKLIRTRITGPGQTPFANFDHDDLVALTVRHAALIKSEKTLAKALIKKDDQRRNAIKRYEQLTISQENRAAATTMQSRLGTDLQHALSNPVIRKIEQSMLAMAATMHCPEQHDHLMTLEAKHTLRTTSMMELCEKYAVNRKRVPDWTPSPKAKDRIARSLKKLEKLEQASQVAYHEFITLNIPNSRPKIVQKSQKKDRTIRPEHQ